MKIFLLLALTFSLPAWAAKIQQQGIVSQSDCASRGISNAVCLPEDNQIYVTANGIDTDLATAITNGAFAGAANSSQLVGNAGLSAAVATNALTINLTTSSGLTPASGTPVLVYFRSGASTVGQFSSLSQTSASSIVVPSGATLGQIGNVAEPTYVYAVERTGGGSFQICVSSNPSIDESQLQSGIAISGSSTSRTALYCGTATTTTPVRLIGEVISTQGIPGVWATAPSAIAVLPFIKGLVVQSGAGASSSMNMEYATTSVACTSSPCALASSSPGVAFISRSAAGTYTLSFNAGSFSSTPACTCSAFRSGATQSVVLCGPQASGVGAFQFPFETIDASASTPADATQFFIQCVGPH